jgi:hypothetical protein
MAVMWEQGKKTLSLSKKKNNLLMFTALEVSFSTWLAVCFALRIVLKHLIIMVVNAIQEARERERERERERD